MVENVFMGSIKHLTLQDATRYVNTNQGGLRIGEMERDGLIAEYGILLKA